MYPVLHQAGFASQAKATHREDGLKLTGAYITAVVHCAPPANKPTPGELANCSAFLDKELALFDDLRVVVTLGKIAFDAFLRYLKRNGTISSGAAYKFGHAAEYKMPDGRYLLASYHPSMQNTNTGKLTEKMFADVFKRAARLAESH
jgi:uracil-DNA glycosylase family 4